MSGNTSLHCSLCNLSFESRRDRKTHVKISGRHPYCAPCNQRFLDSAGLKSHNTQKHTKKRKRNRPRPANPQQTQSSGEQAPGSGPSLDRAVPLAPAPRQSVTAAQIKPRPEGGDTGTHVYLCPICWETGDGNLSCLSCGHVFCTPYVLHPPHVSIFECLYNCTYHYSLPIDALLV